MSNPVSRGLSKVLEGKDVAPVAVKVPQITALFWAIKITSTAMGEAFADWLDGGSGLVFPALGALFAVGAFVVALRMQFRTTRYTTAAYWFAVAMVATFGTMIADSGHQFFSIPYWLTTPIYAVILALVFWRWWANEHTLSIHSIDTRRRERFYWGTVFATFALGTATGDWTATNLHLGFFSSGLMFVGVILLPLIAYRLGVNSIVTFWFAYIITRPLGASFADWMDYPKKSGGLGYGTWPVWISLAVVMTVLVVILSRLERKTDAGAEQHWTAEEAAEHPNPHAPHPHLPHVTEPHQSTATATDLAID